MGVIARQSSKRTIVSFSGVIIGAISTLFIYPLDTETYGLALFLYSSANLLMILMGMGSHGLIIKYFPVFRKEGISGFVPLMFAITGMAVVITSVLLLMFKGPIGRLLDWMQFDVAMIGRYSLPIYGIAVLMAFIYLLNYHASNYRRIVIPTILVELSYKVILPLLVLLAVVGWLNPTRFNLVYVGYFVLVLVAMAIYVSGLKGLTFERIRFSGLKPGLRKEMLTYMLFSGLNQVGATIVARIDTIMVATLISLSDTGIYGILLFMTNVIEIPVRSINQIAGPVLADSMANDDRENVQSVYQKSSVNALVAGLFLFVLIWGILPNIFQIMPDNAPIIAYQNVFLFLGLGKLIDMAFSTNTHIIIYSKYYRYNLLFVLLLGIVNLVLNYFFIRSYGAIGAALATAVSLALYNLVKLVFIHFTLRYWPFTLQTVKLLSIGIIVFFAGMFLPDFFMNWVDLFVKGILITLLFYGLIKIFRLQAEVIRETEKWGIKLIQFVFRK